MSVYYQNGLLYGFEMDPDDILKLEYEDKERYRQITQDKYRFIQSNVGSTSIVIDARSSEFAYVGILQACSETTRNGRASFNSNRKVEFPDNSKLEDLYSLIENLSLSEFIKNEDPQQYIFTMYH